ncbi:MAG: alkanesulfonate-binding protein, partial [Mailhella sp.]|nr:alkanesulfonate-binding protein [Mailhella sp.]
MNMKKIIAAFLHLAMLLTAAPAYAAELPKLASAWMGEFETFVAWYAKNNGWDKEQGFDLSMIPFDSGKSIVESLAATNWSVAGCGAVPSLI